MPFVCAGHPVSGILGETLLAMQAAGASIVEVGIPFSDPVADGPVIASAMHDALQRGTTPRSVLAEVAEVRDRLSIGLVAMVTVSIVHRLGGPEGFSRDAAAAGFDGLIVPDCPLEESDEIRSAAARHGLSCSLLIAPTSSDERAGQIASASTGFAYLVARTGITGESTTIPDIGGRVAAIREVSSIPIACGFGVSTAEHVAAITSHADAAIVGSALVRRMGEGNDPIGAAGDMVAELARGLVPIA
jgi:tryptophan synthase alpha chain